MKKIILFMFWGFLFFACEPIDPRLPYEKNIDPATDPSGFSRALRIEGSNESGDMPINPSNTFSINQAQKEATVTKGATLYVPFTFTSQTPIVGVFLQVVGADNFWKIPTKNVQTASGTYIFSINIPKNILNGSASITYAAFDANGKTTNKIEMNTEVTSTQTVCVAGEPFRASGSRGLYQKTLLLGNKAGVVTISYDMYTLPDRLDIRYNGQWVASTGRLGPPTKSRACFDGQEGYVPGTGTLKVQYDPAISKEIEIYMTGCEGNTQWDLFVSCPDNACSCDKISNIKEITTTVQFPANTEGAKPSGVRVRAGDFVFFGTKNIVKVDNRYFTFCSASGTDKYIDVTKPFGDSSFEDFVYPASAKKYPDYRFGQLILKLNNTRIGADTYGLNPKSSLLNCGGTDALIKFTMIKEYGGYGYFIAEQDGVLEFEINDSNTLDNNGSFDINIVKISRKQHEERNYCNTCPSEMPGFSIGDFKLLVAGNKYSDNKNNTWEFGLGENIKIIGSSTCFHGGNLMFRGVSPSVLNSQCGYDKQGKLVNNNNTMGTYDYGEPASPEHIIMDVFTHEAFSEKKAIYKPTCNIY